MDFVFNPFTKNFDALSESFRTFVPTAGSNVVAETAEDAVTLTSSDSSVVITGNATTDTLDFTGGSGAFAFKTISTPSGTSPVADQMADTLTLAVGTGITITGNSTTDTITWANTINIDQVLANGNTTDSNITFTDEGTGIQWNLSGSVEIGLFYDGADLTFFDNNETTDFYIQMRNLIINPVVQTDVYGTFNFVSGTDIKFTSGAFSSKLDASGTDMRWSKITVGSPNLIMAIPLRMETTTNLQFRDADLSINSSTDGQMDFAADVKILATTPHFQVSNDFEVGATGSFSSSVVINEGGNDADTRIESNDEANMFYVDAGNNRIGIGTATPTEVLGVRGNIALETAGNGIQIKEGSNARMGLAALVAGTATVSNTSVTASTRIFLSRNLTGGTVGHLSTTISAGTSFTINSTSATDTSRIVWFLMEPA